MSIAPPFVLFIVELFFGKRASQSFGSERSYYRFSTAASVCRIIATQVPRLLQQIVTLDFLKHCLLLLCDFEENGHDEHQTEARTDPEHLESELFDDCKESKAHVCSPEQETHASFLPGLREQKTLRSAEGARFRLTSPFRPIYSKTNSLITCYYVNAVNIYIG